MGAFVALLLALGTPTLQVAHETAAAFAAGLNAFAVGASVPWVAAFALRNLLTHVGLVRLMRFTADKKDGIDEAVEAAATARIPNYQIYCIATPAGYIASSSIFGFVSDELSSVSDPPAWWLPLLGLAVSVVVMVTLDAIATWLFDHSGSASSSNT